MKKMITTLLMVIGLCSEAFAHTSLESSTPKNGSIVDKPPTELLLSFANEIRLTAVILSNAANKPVKLKLDKYKKFQTDFSFELALAGDSDQRGEYSIEWRGIGRDGHVMKGSFTYTVK